MNIFVVDEDPQQAARDLCDKHVVKMPLESAQMLCTVLVELGVAGVPYRPSHLNHPCTRWAAATRSNFDWLVTHGRALCNEYTRRYGKDHKSGLVIEWCAQHRDELPDGPLTPHAQAMPDVFRSTSAVLAYRTYYREGKANIVTWKMGPPGWW